MLSILKAASSAMAENKPFVMVSVIASSGSTPRGAGATMIVFEGGHTIGTIGGGAVEHRSIDQAIRLLKEQKSDTVAYCLKPDDVASLGMVCGGAVTACFQFIPPADQHARQLFDYLNDPQNQNKPSWLIRVIENGAVTQMGLYCSGPRFFDGIDQSLILPLLKNRAVLTKTEPQYYVEPVVRPGRVFIFGGGHVSQEVVPAIARVGFVPVVFEDRPDFADPALFPLADEIILGDFKNIFDKVSIGKDDYIIIMTRGHQADFDVIVQSLQTSAAYVGCIGSREKIAFTKKRLADEGHSDLDFDRVHSPIGLDILAETPAEIAVSICAQLIMHRAKLGENHV